MFNTVRMIGGVLVCCLLVGTVAAQTKIPAGGELIVGGFDPGKPADAERMTKELEALMPKLKAAGVTSHEGYVRWNLCEVEEGKFDWSVYDQYVAIYKKNGIKWVPFIIVGSPYSLPDW